MRDHCPNVIPKIKKHQKHLVGFCQTPTLDLFKVRFKLNIGPGSMLQFNQAQCVELTNYWFNVGIEPGSICGLDQLLVQYVDWTSYWFTVGIKPGLISRSNQVQCRHWAGIPLIILPLVGWPSGQLAGWEIVKLMDTLFREPFKIHLRFFLKIK